MAMEPEEERRARVCTEAMMSRALFQAFRDDHHDRSSGGVVNGLHTIMQRLTGGKYGSMVEWEADVRACLTLDAPEDATMGSIAVHCRWDFEELLAKDRPWTFLDQPIVIDRAALGTLRDLADVVRRMDLIAPPDEGSLAYEAWAALGAAVRGVGANLGLLRGAFGPGRALQYLALWGSSELWRGLEYAIDLLAEERLAESRLFCEVTLIFSRICQGVTPRAMDDTRLGVTLSVADATWQLAERSANVDLLMNGIGNGTVQVRLIPKDSQLYSLAWRIIDKQGPGFFREVLPECTVNWGDAKASFDSQDLWYITGVPGEFLYDGWSSQDGRAAYMVHRLGDRMVDFEETCGHCDFAAVLAAARRFTHESIHNLVQRLVANQTTGRGAEGAASPRAHVRLAVPIGDQLYACDSGLAFEIWVACCGSWTGAEQYLPTIHAYSPTQRRRQPVRSEQQLAVSNHVRPRRLL
jgi:hypothetical protein